MKGDLYKVHHMVQYLTIFFSPPNFFMPRQMNILIFGAPPSYVVFGFVGSLLSFLCVFCPLLDICILFFLVVVNSFLYGCIVFPQLQTRVSFLCVSPIGSALTG